MVLDPVTFATELDRFGNSVAAVFEAGPVDADDARLKHAHAFRVYMETLTNPVVLPTAHDEAESAMAAALVGQALPPPGSITAINAGYSAYVAVIIAAAGLTGQVSAPPPASPGPIPAFLPIPIPGLGTVTYAAGVDAWVRSGASSIPPVTPVPWG